MRSGAVDTQPACLVERVLCDNNIPARPWRIVNRSADVGNADRILMRDIVDPVVFDFHIVGAHDADALRGGMFDLVADDPDVPGLERLRSDKARPEIRLLGIAADADTVCGRS